MRQTPDQTAPAETPQNEAPAPARPKLDRNFFWLLLSSFISLTGDQFTLIGLPWLTLKLTGDPMALGLVLAVAGIPRAAFILLGGAIVDRYSPKRVLIASKYVNTALLGILAALVYANALTLPLLYVLAAAIGLASAFAYPAGSSIMPFVVPREALAKANGLMMGIRQVTFFIGPLIAGLVIALFGADGLGAPGLNGGVAAASEMAAEATGLAVVFAFDAFSFLASAVMLHGIRMLPHPGAGTAAGGTAPAGVFRMMLDGIRAVAADRELRALFIYMALVQVLVIGPMQVGLPVFAESRLDGGAASFGTIMAANGAGVLLGVLLAGAGVKTGLRTLGQMLLTANLVIGFIIASFAVIHSTLVGGALMLVTGVFGGLVQVKFIAWIQGRTPPAQMGRVMGFFMFIVMGIAPVAASLAGWVLAQTGIVTLFLVCGALLSLTAGTALTLRSMRAIGEGY